MTRPDVFLRKLFDTAVAAASPKNCMQKWLPMRPDGRMVIVGAGKAAASMALELEKHWAKPLEGVVIVPYGHSTDCKSIEIIEAAHPVPDEAGLAAARTVLERVSDLFASDTVVCLLSGGGSALLSLPASGVTLAEKQAVTSQLLRSGAAIHEINCVRKKLSAIKGGKLAAACAPAAVITLLISDVPGNDASIVASGPTIADTTTRADALAILKRFDIAISDAVRAAIETSEVVNIVDADVRILATSDDAMLASAAFAEDQNITPYVLGDLNADATQLAEEHAELALQIACGQGPITAPCVILSGGETTVNVRGDGRGGRNGEYALALAIALNGHASISAIACDTDGIDGAGDNAGSLVSPDTLARAAASNVNANEMKDNNDSYNFFAAINDLVFTGPTLTNVNDFRAIHISE
ncbi:MAG: glycerate kinase [Proteobacteria bacterium]|nr:glycerate kinase [Pseudomonadota bacterium]